MGVIRSVGINKVTGGLLTLFLILAVAGCGGGDGSSGTPPSQSGDLSVWYVSTTGNDTVNTCHTAQSPCKTIQWAVSHATNGAVVHIADGAYSEHLTINTKGIQLEGSGLNTILENSAYAKGFGYDKGGVITMGCPGCYELVKISNMTISSGKANLGGIIFAADVELIMENVRIADGMGGSGGGLYITGDSTVKLENVTIEYNSSSEPSDYAGGGGIFNDGILTMSNSTISNNASACDGGGLLNEGKATLNNVLIEKNQAEVNGGGINNYPGILTLNNSTLKNNSAVEGGGGLYSAGQATLSGGTIDGNSAEEGGGILQEFGGMAGHLTATDISIINNEAKIGGGVANRFTYNEGIVAGLGYLQIEQSTIAYNHAFNGGGIHNTVGGSFFLINDTISNNTVDSMGGGIFNADQGLALNVTIAHNTAGGAGFYSAGAGIMTAGGDLDLQNVLLAGNEGENCKSSGGTISSRAGNLSDDSTCNLTGPLDQNNVDAKIGMLTYNGGATQTIALDTDSPAVDTAVGFLAPQIDQRYASRGLDGNGDGITGFDIGAYEVASVITSGQANFTVMTATPGSGIFTFQEPGNCRAGPGANYDILTSAPVGTVASVDGRNLDASWYHIQLRGTPCWVNARIGLFDSEPLALEIREALPSPTPVYYEPEATVTEVGPGPATVNCSAYTSLLDCINNPACTISGAYCVNK